MLKKTLIAKTDAKADSSQIYVGDGWRVTYLTSRLIRYETGCFNDLPSTAVWFRRFECPGMKVDCSGKTVTVETEDVIFTVKNFTPYSVYFKDTKNTEVFSRQKNLKGTCRTLDMTNGKAKLGDGFITENGAYLFDDSTSLLFDEEGRFTKRDGRGKDYYLFAYGKDYRSTINAFYKISSKVPLIPRFALGVWWSRYHAYTQQEYLDLMIRFRKEGIPLTVATVDMDWHWVKIKKELGFDYNGWTGYSWNTQLFPDYKGFLKQLHDMNLSVTLNLHPADGFREYEDMYEDMAKAVGIDSKSKKPVEFSCSNDDFWNAYFDIAHKPYERDGVDFWWIDWQQGTKSDAQGLDPLQALNHYHFLDIAENGRLPLILSRYSGAGSHRYPLGFSGDTLITWKSLDFQPYFTANAANAAYTWWSHDIGGHMFGTRDDELYIRWLQFGVFSPIMRLHSSNMLALGKEPWKYSGEVCRAAKYWLNLRHKLIPYIYTMDHRTHEQGVALCEPMYYSYPDKKEAYEVPNQYMFGSELMICPITSPNNKKVLMGSVKAWIPQGRWTDIFTLKSYTGEKMLELFRDTETIPVLAKEGAIIPMSADEGNSSSNPETLEIWAFSGDGSFELVEDDGTVDYSLHSAKTKFEMKYSGGKLSFTVNAAEGDLSVIPEKRNYVIKVRDLTVGGEELVLYLNGADVNESYTLTAENANRFVGETAKERTVRILSRWQGFSLKKEICCRLLGEDKGDMIRKFNGIV
ncbi:MAG: DUF5110 domain-containing protein, partial [Clostridia bacterium]|nr:DUF5110 domain-containing protein [Clostridia bacterium]